MIAALALPWLLGLGLTLGLEAMLRPAVAPPWRRPAAALAVHLGTWGLLFGLFLLVLQRPWFALAFILSLQLVVVQSSNTKWRTLREPFICQDFEYFLDALRHPRLYVPFFGIWLALGAGAAGLGAIVAFLVIEPSLVGRVGAGAFLAAALLPAGLSLLPLALGLARLPDCSLMPREDLHRLGLFAALWAYGLKACQGLELPDGASPHWSLPATPPPTERLPHVVAVQSESFFDPRPWHGGLRRELLAHYDALAEAALAHGPLSVPAWGANTVRTEAAFLTGLDEATLGIHRFNPYHQLARRPVPSLAAGLRALGYRTVCVHPYPAGFYGRDRVMPRLGFDDFLDIRAFDPGQRCGQYIGDLAVADRVGSLLSAPDNSPLFIFVITMENHGPLQLDPLARCEAGDPLAPGVPPLPRDCGELVGYLAHLRNADLMLQALQRRLSEATRPGLLCWYGDHVPIMPSAYRHFGPPDGRTTYTLWSSDRRSTTRDTTPLNASQLGLRLWRAVLETPHDVRDEAGRNSKDQEQA